MKNDFWILTILVLLTRISDFYSTSLWYFQPGGMEGETNPLSRFFGVGWYGLIFVNVVVVALTLWGYYYYCYQYKPIHFENPPADFKAYISRLYYGVDDQFSRIYYQFANDKSTRYAHLGYVMIRLVIVGGVLATIHNLCQFYDVEIYNIYRSIVKRPLYVIYLLIILSLIYFQYRVMMIEYEGRFQSLNTQ